ncbi:Zn(II)2Cys6 transcription factor domain-containing protein [Aspergillus foveolatus]|uniref:Zn(II)2Cys6 transcription factor domain-containing protein n=1 Tax=Aspergillus foveolatus TaxID=210207 RepID=UPI003CCCD2C8
MLPNNPGLNLPTASDANRNKDKDKLSKPRPVTSCSACRIRKVKCNRASPCSACISRKTPSECTYASTVEDREAIAAAETIAELRGIRSELQEKLAKATAGKVLDGGGEDDEEAEALEAVYAIVKGGSVDLISEVVGRIRAGEEVGGVLAGLGVR